jgi:molecular chaperone DnaK
MLKDTADKISADDKSKIEKAIADVKEALKSNDSAAIKSASDRLNEAWQAVSTELYRAASEKARAEKAASGKTETGTGGEAPPGGDKGEPIIDAEVVDDKK